MDAINEWKAGIQNLTKEDFENKVEALLEDDEYAENAILDFLLGETTIDNFVDTSKGATFGEYLYAKGVLNDGYLYNRFKERLKALGKPEEKPQDGNEGKFFATNITVKSGLNTSNRKDNFRATNEIRDFKVQIGDRVTDGKILNKASSLANGSIFMYDGNPYVKVATDDGYEVWRVEQKTWTDWTGQYAALLDAAKANMKTTANIYKASADENVLYYDGLTAYLGGSDDAATEYANKNGVTNGNIFEKDGVYYFYNDAKAFTITNEVGMGRVGYDEIVKRIRENEKLLGIQDGDVTPISATLSGTADIGWLGNNFTVDIDGKEYKVQTATRAPTSLEDFVTRQGSGIAEKSLFIYDGNLYMRDKRKVYSIEARPDFHTSDYKKLLEKTGLYTPSDKEKLTLTPIEGVELSGVDINRIFNNFKATIGGEEYKVQANGRAPDDVEEAATEEGSGIPEKGLFTHNGTLYMRSGNKVWNVEARYLEKHKDDYESLLKVAELNERENAPEQPSTPAPEQPSTPAPAPTTPTTPEGQPSTASNGGYGVKVTQSGSLPNGGYFARVNGIDVALESASTDAAEKYAKDNGVQRYDFFKYEGRYYFYDVLGAHLVDENYGNYQALIDYLNSQKPSTPTTRKYSDLLRM